MDFIGHQVIGSTRIIIKGSGKAGEQNKRDWKDEERQNGIFFMKAGNLAGSVKSGHLVV